jgi:Domain of unknown function (DUF4158)
MTGDYPRFKTTYTHDDLVEHCLLSPADHAVIDTCDGDANRHGVAVLLKSIQYLGYFPADLPQVPQEIRTFIAPQLERLWDHTVDYPWHSSTRDRHLALIRQHLGWRFPTGQDKQALEIWGSAPNVLVILDKGTIFQSVKWSDQHVCNTTEIWLRIHGVPEAPTDADLGEGAYARLQRVGIELPAEQELQRIVRAALHGFFHEVHERVAAQLSETVHPSLDQLLVVGSADAQSAFDQLKAQPSAPGVQHLQQELTKLQTLRAIGVPAEALAEVPCKVWCISRGNPLWLPT